MYKKSLPNLRLNNLSLLRLLLPAGEFGAWIVMVHQWRPTHKCPTRAATSPGTAQSQKFSHSTLHQLPRCQTSKEMHLPSPRYEFKFIVDGTWTTSDEIEQTKCNNRTASKASSISSRIFPAPNFGEFGNKLVWQRVSRGLLNSSI